VAVLMATLTAVLAALLVVVLFLVVLGGPELRAAVAAVRGLVAMALMAMRLVLRVLVGPASRWP